MATASVPFMSREDHRRQLELEEARRAGLVPAEVDDDGKEINPHIPQYISRPPWYVDSERRSLEHQKKRESNPDSTKSPCIRGQKGFQADKYRKGACTNCGAMTHDAKSCTERPRKLGANITGKFIARDEVVQENKSDYDTKHDRWDGYDPAMHAHVVQNMHEATEKARMKYLMEPKLKYLKEKNNKTGKENDACDDEAKIDESKQMDFAKVEKRVRTSGGGITGTVRDLRLREDTAKYLLNCDVNSAYYDPKSRSMREDPLPDTDPNEKFNAGDNQNRLSGQASEFKQLNLHAWETFSKGQDVHLQAAPSQAELQYKNFKINKECLKSQMKKIIQEKYGNASTVEEIPRELLLGQSECQIEYDRAGRIIKEQEDGKGREKIYKRKRRSNDSYADGGDFRGDIAI